MQTRKEEWETLADLYLPLKKSPDGVWRSSRVMYPDEPDQGWKLHISATVLDACSVLRLCGNYLQEHDVLFKGCATLELLEKLNTGLFYGFSQIGKMLTIYPRNAKRAMEIARDLDELTREFRGPKVPFDLPYRLGSCVYYRYGGFRPIEVVGKKGERSTAVRDPSGKYWTDRREAGHAVPAWVLNPFEVFEEPVDVQSALCTRFLTYEALSQRGKGGTYRCLDILADPVRKCVIKEGRPHGETAFDGRDGRAFLEDEERALRCLSKRGVAVPGVVGTFEVGGHRYLAMEELDGVSMMQICSHPRRRLPLDIAGFLALRTCELVATIHEAGWVWRDLKPLNLIVSESGQIWGIDFEGAVRIDAPSRVPWGTPGYTPPELKQGPVTGTNLPEDLYALGATLRQIYTSVVPERGHDEPGPRSGAHPRMRLGLPQAVRRLIRSLLAENPALRPSAAQAAGVLRALKHPETVSIEVKAYQRQRRIRPKPLKEGLVDELPGVENVVLMQRYAEAEMVGVA